MIKLKALVNEVQTGKPFRGIVYRGDDKQFEKFDRAFVGRSTGTNTVGFWFTDSADAAGFYGQYVRAFKITMNNPLIVTEEEFFKGYPDGPPKFAARAEMAGHDGVIILNIQDGDRRSNVYCVWNTDQITNVEFGRGIAKTKLSS